MGKIIKTRVRPDSTLHDERIRLDDILDSGDMTMCALCGQHAKVYRRTIYSTMARHLITAYRAEGRDWFRLTDVIKDKDGTFAKLALWDLVEEESVRRPDGGRSGWWRVTRLGEKFVRNRTTVPKYVLTYNARIVEIDATEEVGVLDALGKKFRYDDLMRGK
jgi:hypothetical protein